MQVNRQQRLSSVGPELIHRMRGLAEEIRGHMKDGVDLPAGKPAGFPPFKCTGLEVKESLGDNLKPMETAVDFILDGKMPAKPTEKGANQSAT